jgi:hypothetical protein
MSLADKSSLLFIPSGYIAQKVYSIFPTSGVGDFTFSRSGSATRIAKNGLITTVDSNIPRLEYPLIDGEVVGCPSLILEPARTNLITYSEDVSQWINVNTTISQDDVISPDGTLNADKFEFTGDGSIRPNTSQLTFTNDYCFSVFIKKGNARYVTLWARFFTTETIIGFDLDTNTSENGGNIEDFGNDWYRLSINNNVTGDADRTGVFYIFLPNSLGGSNSVSGNNAYVWGAQVEEGSYPTSYIKSNSGSTTTRSAETANGSGDAATFNDSEGVLMAEISALTEDSGLSRRITISDGSTNNRVSIELDETEGLIKLFFSGNGTLNQLTKNISDVYTPFKILASYELNSLKLYINGYKVSQDTSIVLPNGLDDLSFDNGTGASNFYGKTKQIQYYNSALTDSELEQLTSWTSFTDMAEGQQYSIK